MKRFPLFLGKENASEKTTVVSIEVSDETTLIARYPSESTLSDPVLPEVYNNSDFPSVYEILTHYKNELGFSPTDVVSISVPGPVLNGRAEVPRLKEVFDEKELQKQLSVSKVYLLNDLEAQAYGLAELKKESFLHVHNENVDSKGNVALLAPGVGLGEAGLYFDGQFLHPFATEGGHSEFSPRTTVEVEFYQYLKKIYGIVSWENVLSNKGLFNIFRFLRDEKRYPVTQRLNEAMASPDRFVKVLYEAAYEDKELIATVTVNTFLEFLAREANSLVLKLKAIGGLIITGSLIRQFAPYIDFQRFYNKFIISDKMEALLRTTSVYILDDTHLALRGAAVFAWAKTFSEK